MGGTDHGGAAPHLCFMRCTPLVAAEVGGTPGPRARGPGGGGRLPCFLVAGSSLAC